MSKETANKTVIMLIIDAARREKYRLLVHNSIAAQDGCRTLCTIYKLGFAILVISLLIGSNQCHARTISSGGNSRRPVSGGSQHEDLIEGRLDTSQLCGTRQYNRLSGRQVSSNPRDFYGLDNNNNNETRKAFANEDNLLYIVNGDEVEDDQSWPWSIAIYELDPMNGSKDFICSGSLISEKFILTAAHCIQQSRFDILSPKEIFLKIASLRLDDKHSEYYRVEQVFVHPEYAVDRKANDIALLKLLPGQTLPHRARPICLPSQVANRIDFTHQQVTIIGWGRTDAMSGDEPTRLIDVPQSEHTNYNLIGVHEKNPIGSRRSQTNDSLLQAEVRIIGNDQCNRDYSRLDIGWLQIDERFLCASDPNGKSDACQGDSGGPLMWSQQTGPKANANSLIGGSSEKWYQLGLVAFGHGCANAQFPGVYTRISYYIPWILKIVNSH